MGGGKMKYKEGVRIRFLYPKMADLQNVINVSVPQDYEPTITSANDSKHMDTSLHYKDKAYDIRTRDFPGFDLNKFEETRHVIDDFIDTIKKYLASPDEFDFVFGDKKHQNHIHVEWDVK